MTEVFFKGYVPKSGAIEVPPSGSLSSPICIVGEAPASNEIAQGIPFVGRSGELLDSILTKVGLSREQCYITNLFKFEVSKKRMKVGASFKEAYFKGKDMLWREDLGFSPLGNEYKEKLMEELSSFKGNVIVPMGNAALFALLGVTKITKRRGSIYLHPTLKKKVIPTIHPAAAFRTYLYRYLIKIDFDKIKRESTFPEMKEREMFLRIEPTFTDAVLFLKRCKESKTVAFDIETLRGQMSAISFALSDNEAMSIPFVIQRENYYTLEQEIELMTLISEILEDKRITKIGQNIAFDMTYLFMRYGIVTENWEDTMIIHKILYPEFPAGLDFITANYTDLPYYKDEGKDQIKAPHDWKTYWRYNAKDSLACMIAFPKLKWEAEKIGNWDAYVHQKELIHPIMYMGQRGIRVDVERLEELRKKAEEEKEKILDELIHLTGENINPVSSQQCQAYFYGKKKIKPYVRKGKPTMDEGALVRLKRRGFKEADLILRYRSLNTMLTRYYNVRLREYPDGTKRLTTFYKPVTAMGRLASSKDLDDYGGNEQNQPKKMNIVFLADEGYMIFNVDLSQADARTVAYYGNVKKMKEAFETGIDIHSLTASGIFGIPPDEIKRMNSEGIKAPLGYGDQTHRFWGKKCNHSLNFDIGVSTFSFNLEIPEKEGARLIEAYHSLYPEVRKGYHAKIREQLNKSRTVMNCFGRKFLLLGRWDHKLFKDAYAFPAQSNTAEIINRWGLLEFYYKEEYKEVDLLRQVHDSINFQLPLRLGFRAMASLLLKMRASIERPLEWEGRKFTIPSDWSGGFNLGEQTELRMDEGLDSLEKQLKEIYEKWKGAKNGTPKHTDTSYHPIFINASSHNE